MTRSSDEATRLLGEIAAGDADAARRLLPIVYDQLRALAAGLFRGQPADHTLQPTILVHEAFLRLVDQSSGAFRDRAHFIAVAATAMRQILTDHARRVRAAKRGGGWNRVDVDPPQELGPALVDLVALDDALAELAALDERKHRIVELRYFGGLTVEEVADLLGLSKRTIESDWRAARAWLGARLGDSRRTE
ncbi:MAG TPA: ECF-type sigma factor [Phycisphaerales bacterium]|nr:ECF-type sigma factor [Phycisphaerales bacterium]HMP36053.1 ECF-type sigma factor [Phycisphaerales bacterium]